MEKGEKWEEDSLEVRRSRVRNEGSSSFIESSSSSSSSATASEEEDSAQLKGNDSKTNGHVIYSTESVTSDYYVGQEFKSSSSVLDESKEKEKDGPEDVLLAPVVVDSGIHKETEITEEGQSKLNNSVYYDKNEGIWKCQVCCWNYGTSSLCSELIQKPNGHLHQPMYCKTLSSGGSCFNFEVAEHIKQNHGDDALGITAANITDQKNLDLVVDCEHEGIQKNVDLSTSQHSEISPAECIPSSSSSKVAEIETVGIDFADESDDLDGGELDVETVLQKQKTHDLYCPNCNSCITRRVILRKRKRRVHINSEDVKHNKLETVTDSKGKDIDNQTTSDQVPDTSNIHLDGTSELASNEYDREREPDIFRCLSCFSIFIPTGKGFKLFQIFGDKGKKTMEDQPIPSTTLSERDRTIAQSGSGDTQKTSSRDVPSSNFNDLHRTAEVHSNGDKASPSTVQQQLMPGAVNASDVNTKKKDTGDYLRNPLEVSTGNQPIAPNVSSGMTYFQGDQSAAASTNGTPAPKGDSQYDPISVYQHDGLKLLIPTNVVSTNQENLQEQKPELKIQNIAGPSAGSEPILSMPPKSSEQKDEGVSGKTIFQVEVFHEHEQHDGTMVPNFSAYENGTQDKVLNKDGAHPYEPPKQTNGKKKIEIHGGEHLKINKDILVLSIKEPIMIHDKQADTIKDLKKMTIEQLADKDTVIVVEAGASKTTDSQLLADSNASAELGTSPHLTTGIDVVVEQSGADAGETYEIEIIKSVVYGGLVESITSLGVVSSAAGGGTPTLNILALSMANLIGGLVLVAHNLWDLKKYHVREVPNQQTGNIDRYRELLGRRENFVVHATVAVLSFIIFGLISPITYAFSFQKSDDRDFKLFASAAASLLCIVLLGTGKAYVRTPPKSYMKTLGYYALLGFSASGISYAAGELIKRLLEKFHVLQSNSSLPISFANAPPDSSHWASF